MPTRMQAPRWFIFTNCMSFGIDFRDNALSIIVISLVALVTKLNFKQHLINHLYWYIQVQC